MLISTFNEIEIKAIACAVPEQEITAESIYHEHGQEFTEKIKKTIAVNTIRKSIKKQTASDLGYVAAKKIIDAMNIDPNAIGLLIFVTQSPDYLVPATSCILHKRLDLSLDCATVDVNNGCAGYVYGMNIAFSMLNNLNCEYAMLIVGDTSSYKKKDKELLSKRVSVPFGDGTSATLLKKSNNAKPVEISLRTDGGGYHSLIKYSGGLRAKTYSSNEIKKGYRKNRYPLMNGVEVFNFSITRVPEQINQFIAYQKKHANDYDSIILHQPNLLMIKQIAKRIGANIDNVPISLYKYGNTSGASIPITLVDRYGGNDCGEINTLMCGFGIGLLWGTMSATIDTKNILPMLYSDDFYEDPGLDNYSYD